MDVSLVRLSPLWRFDGGCVPESSDDFLRLLDLPGLAAARTGDLERERDLEWDRDLFLAALVAAEADFALLPPFPPVLLPSSEVLESLALVPDDDPFDCLLWSVLVNGCCRNNV